MNTLYVVATPIGNLEDISPRALRILAEVDLIAAEDTRRTGKLLTHFGIDTPTTSYYKFNEKSRAEQLVSRILQEKVDIALVSDAGTPCISDPGGVLVKLAHERGIQVLPIPGASSVAAALSVCGFEFSSFAFVGFVPRENKPKAEFWSKIKRSEIDVHVIFESGHRILQTVADLAEYFPNSELCLVNDISKLYECYYFGSTSEVNSVMMKNDKANLGEYTLVLQCGKLDKVAEDEQPFSPEAMLVDEIVKNGTTLSEAISSLSEKQSDFSRNQLYKASLNLKKMQLPAE